MSMERDLQNADKKKDECVSTEAVVEILPTQTYYQPTTKEEKALDKKVNLKIDFILLPLLASIFLFVGIDLSNIGNAATTSFLKDANLAPNDIGNSVSLVFATFVPLQPFSIIAARRVGLKYWIPCMMVLTGGLAMAHAGIKNRGTLFALRLLLGAADAGSVQTIFYYITTLYPHFTVGSRLGFFAAMYGIAGGFSGLLAYSCFHIKSSQFKSWQIMFLIEGGMTTLVGIVSIFVIPSNPETAWFLSPAEKLHAARRLQADHGLDREIEDVGNVRRNSRKVTWQDVRDAITDWRKILLILCNMLAILPTYVFGTFLPLIVHGMGYSGIKANLMSVSPSVVAGVGVIAFTFSSDHFKDRSIHIVLSLLIALIGLLVMIISSNQRLRYAFTHICLGGAGSSGPLIIAWLADNTPGEGTRSVILGLNGCGNVAAVMAGQLFKAKYAPSYRYPLVVTVVLVGLNMAGVLAIRGLYFWENRRRKREVEGWSGEMIEQEIRSDVRRGDKKLTFVYGY